MRPLPALDSEGDLVGIVAPGDPAVDVHKALDEVLVNVSTRAEPDRAAA